MIASGSSMLVNRTPGKHLGVCAMCLRFRRMTKHHIVPLKLRPTSKRCLMICRGCHHELNSLSLMAQVDFVSELIGLLTGKEKGL